MIEEEARKEVRLHWTNSKSMKWITRFPLTATFLCIAGAFVVIWPEDSRDIARCIQIGGAAFIAVFSVIIIAIHYVLAKQMHYSETRLLPWHVQLIATSYLIFVSGLTIQVIKLLGEPVEWNIMPLGLVGDITGIAALGFVWKLELAKARKAGSNV